MIEYYDAFGEHERSLTHFEYCKLRNNCGGMDIGISVIIHTTRRYKDINTILHTNNKKILGKQVCKNDSIH